MGSFSSLTLLDVAWKDPVEYTLVYSGVSDTTAWWARLLHPQFVHVEVWRPLGQGFYLALQPYHDYVTFNLIEGEPSGTLQKVTALRKRGTPLWPIGLKTCVTIAKAALGIRNGLVLTPSQLHRYIEERKRIV